MKSWSSRITRSVALAALVCAPLATLVVVTAGTASALSAGNNVSNPTDLQKFEDGSYTHLDLTTDLTLSDGDCGQYVRDTGNSLVFDGHGFTITQSSSCDDRIFKQHDIGPITFQHITLSGGNRFDGSGGAVSSDGPITLIDSTFSDNSVTYGNCDQSVIDVDAPNYCGWPVGGAIFSETTVTLTDSSVTGNHADDSGGGIFSAADVNLTNSHIDGNTAGGAEAEYCWCSGGGFVSEGSAVVDGSTVNDNSATCLDNCGASGGGFLAEGATSVTNSSVNGNDAGCDHSCDALGGGFSGGGLTANMQTAGQTNARVGAAVVADAGAVLVDHSDVSGDSATCNEFFDVATAATYGYNCGAGGGFYAYQATAVDVTASTLSDNTATTYGGALSTGTKCDTDCEPLLVRVTNSTVTGNSSGGSGAIDVSGPDETLNLTYDTIDANTLTDLLQQASAGNVRAQLTQDPAANVSATDLHAFATNITDPIGGVNCEIWDAADSSGYNYLDDDSCQLAASSDSDASANDPLLGALGDNGGATPTQLPKTGSPLIDNVLLADCSGGDTLAGVEVTTDQRDITRPQIKGCDTGAVEVEAASISVVKTVSGLGGQVVPFAGPYSFGVTCTDGSAGTLTVASPSGGKSDSLGHIKPGSTCTVAEKPVVVDGVAAGTTYAPSASIVVKADTPDGSPNVVTVNNDYAQILAARAIRLQPKFTG